LAGLTKKCPGEKEIFLTQRQATLSPSTSLVLNATIRKKSSPGRESLQNKGDNAAKRNPNMETESGTTNKTSSILTMPTDKRRRMKKKRPAAKS